MPHSTQHLSYHRNTPQTPPRPVCRQLSSSSTDDNTPASTPECSEDKEEEEDFHMVPLDDELCASEELSERTLCIHEHGLPHWLCPYPCPYMQTVRCLLTWKAWI